MGIVVTAIVLAAGRSRRMGRPKQLLQLNGIPLVEHCLKTLASSPVDEIVLVAGQLYNVLAPMSRRYRSRMVRNSDCTSDMADSVRMGLASARVDATGVLVYPADYPQVKRSTIDALLERHIRTPQDILIPIVGQRRGHPALFPRYLLKGFGSKTTLRDVMRLHAGHVQNVPVDDDGILMDIDTPEEYRQAKRLMEG